MSLFFNSSVQTSMVKRRNFIPIETFDDLFDRNLPAMFVGFDCESLVRLIPKRNIRDKILENSEFMHEKSDISELDNQVMKLRSKFAIIAKREELSMLFHLECSSIGRKTLSRKDVYLSSKSVLTTIGSTYLSKHTPSSVLKTFTKVAYGSFEMKLFYDSISLKLARHMIEQTDVKCANEEMIDGQASFSSLDLIFFANLFHLYSLGMLIAFSIFIMEVFKPLIRFIIF